VIDRPDRMRQLGEGVTPANLNGDAANGGAGVRAVPEPSSLAICVGLGVGMCVRRRRSRLQRQTTRSC
jgi:hypothetical protein